MKWIERTLLLLMLVVTTVTQAQEIEESEESETLKIQFKPRVGIGVGMFTFYGDVASNHQGYHPTVSKLGYDLTISNPLTDYLDIKFYGMMGTIGANERSLSRNLNFQSDITTGGFVINYNFAHLVKPNGPINPFIGIGIESIEFLSKTDLYDANGNFYHYWSDGSIRDIAENSPLAPGAQLIYRDYTYETDLRELNLDNLGKYPERTLSIPIQLGARMNLGERMKFRIGTSLHLTMSDLIDNVTSESEGDRAGTKGNDKFLYTSFALTYDLKINKRKRGADGEFEWGPEDCIKDTLDEDNDGIADMCDDCQNTPLGVDVDEFGCPMDSDNDLVPDYADEEMFSPDSSIVDIVGVALTDDDILDRYLRYIDTTGKYDGDYFEDETIETSTVPGQQVSGNFEQFQNKVYRVLVGTSEKEILANDIAGIISFKNYKMVVQGDTTYFVLGEFDSPEGAQELANLLDNKGISNAGIVETIKQDNGNVDVNPIAPIPDLGLASYPEGALFRIQIGAFNDRLTQKVFADIPDISEVVGDDGLVRYYSGEFSTPEEAAKYKIDLLSRGYEGTFIVVFKNGERVKLSQGGFSVLNPEFDSINPILPSPTTVSNALIKFRVQVGAYALDVPTDVLDLFLQLGNVIPKKDSKDNLVKYFVGNFENYDQASEFKRRVILEGITDAFVVGDFKGQIISVPEAFTLILK
ncbi:SPOR domain-containing protein [Flavobacteriales bacterium]|nr:SPOR domain-containing protein [Flavobacteriales bacterium]